MEKEIIISRSWPDIKCPRCRQPIKVNEVLFQSNFTVIFNGICCKHHITSGEINLMELIPIKDGKGN